MIRLVVYSFPAAMDVVLSAALFVCMVRVAETHASAKAVAVFMPIWALVYMLSSLTAGHIVTRRNAARLLIAACIGTGALSVGFVLSPNLAAMYVLVAMLGVTTAFFFTPFQVFMKLVDAGRNKGISHSTGLYTFAWSSGYALGPFIAGYLWDRAGWQGCHIFNGIVTALIAVGVHLLKHHADFATTACRDDSAPPPRQAEYAAMPDLAWMAWVFGGAGCLVIALIRGVFPSSGAAYGIPKPEQGTILFTLSAMQAVVGLALSRSRGWMYRPGPVLAFGLFGVAGLALLYNARHPAMFLLGAGCFGVYSGSFFFYFVFHSLVHPTRSGRYVSINEAVVGMTSIAGPFLGGSVADRHGLPASYLAGLIIVVIAVAAQVRIHQTQRR